MATEEQLRAFGRTISAVASGKVLTRTEAREAYRQIILNEQPELQQGAFLAAHLARGPVTEELAGAWDALDLYDTAKIQATPGSIVADIVGTGSDPLKTVNGSTPAACIAAGCGLRVAKKGARLVTGVAGASDILETLGVDLTAPLARAENCLRHHGIAYLPGEAFLRSGWARLIQSMRFTSAFNIIGPLTRPCPQTEVIVIGAYSPSVCDQLIQVLAEIGMRTAFAPYGWVDGGDPALGMDEFSPCGPTRVALWRNGQAETIEVTPKDFGFDPCPFSRVATRSNAHDNAEAIVTTLKTEHDSPLGDFFCMNAAALLFASDLCDSWSSGMDMARQSLATGKAWEKMMALRTAQGRTETQN
jgi:anthranilate phosphoribosyltransferase